MIKVFSQSSYALSREILPVIDQFDSVSHDIPSQNKQSCEIYMPKICYTLWGIKWDMSLLSDLWFSGEIRYIGIK